MIKTKSGQSNHIIIILGYIITDGGRCSVQRVSNYYYFRIDVVGVKLFILVLI